MPSAKHDASGAALFTAAAHLEFIKHEAILQTLDRKDLEGVYLSKEAYEDTVDAWNDVPLIFAQDHPDPKKFDEDPEAELKRIRGRLISGKATNTRIEITGHPRLMTTFKIQDEEIEKGITDGKISTSNGFWPKYGEGKKLIAVKPHHILFFREGGNDIPGDRGVFILQKAKHPTFNDGPSGGSGQAGREDSEDESMTDKELESKLAVAEKEAADAKLAFTQLQTDKAKLDETIKAKDAEIKRLNNEIMTFKAKEADAKWATFKAKYIPPGMVEGDKEKAAREEFEADPLTFTMKIMDMRVEEAEDSGAEPIQYTTAKAKAREKEVDAELRKFGATNVSIKEA